MIDIAIQYVSSPNHYYFERAGRIYEALKEYDTANYYYMKSLEINPNYYFAKEGLSRIEQITKDE